MSEQLTLALFQGQHPELHEYWRSELKSAVKDAWRYRHRRWTTGWSTACSGDVFSQFLVSEGQISKEMHARYLRFFDRISKMPWSYPCEENEG